MPDGGDRLEASAGLQGQRPCLRASDRRGRSPGGEYDSVTRSFGPKLGVYEDPVCGSGHCHVVPYWAEATGKTSLRACRASKRTGELFCRPAGDRLFIAGDAVLFAKTVLHLPPTADIVV